jgi:hypothetical protein
MKHNNSDILELYKVEDQTHSRTRTSDWIQVPAIQHKNPKNMARNSSKVSPITTNSFEVLSNLEEIMDGQTTVNGEKLWHNASEGCVKR